MKRKSPEPTVRAEKSRQSSMLQTALWLPRDVHEKLKAAGGERGLGEEIRRRLDATIKAEAVGDETCRLIDAISPLAGEVSGFYGAWFQDAFAFQVFKAALNTMLDTLKPEGEPVPHPNVEGLTDIFFGQNDPPDDVGRMIAGLVLRDHPLRPASKSK